MSAKLMGRVWELELPHNHQSVLLAFADHADDEGFNARPGVEYVAWKTGYSERQVQRIVRELERDGLLTVVDQAAGRLATAYRVVLSAGKGKAAYVPRHKRRPDNMSPRHSEPSRPDISGRRGDTQMSPEPGTVKEPSSKTPKGPLIGQVLSVLEEAARGRGAPMPAATAVERAIVDLPDRDHLAVAKEVRHWLLESENGRKARAKDVASRFRNFLRRSDPAPATSPRVDWAPWVAEHLPELDGAAAIFAAQSAAMLAGGNLDVTPEIVQARIDARLAVPEVEAA